VQAPCAITGQPYAITGQRPTRHARRIATSRCNSETRSTVAPLEKKLTDKKIELPRPTVAQQPGSTGSSQ
jgi:hypothetical protein